MTEIGFGTELGRFQGGIGEFKMDSSWVADFIAAHRLLHFPDDLLMPGCPDAWIESAAGAQTYQGVNALVWLVCPGINVCQLGMYQLVPAEC